MSATSRYWDHERCAWVAYESAPRDTPEALDEALPEQRADAEPRIVDSDTPARRRVR